MYQNRASILKIKFISNVIPSPSSSCSSSFQDTISNILKPSLLTHSCLIRSFGIASQRFDFSLDSDPDRSGKQNPYGNDSSNSTNLQRNPKGYAQQLNSNGFCGGHNGSINSTGLQQNSSGFHKESSDSYQRCNLGDARQPNLNGFQGTNANGYQRNNHQWDSSGSESESSGSSQIFNLGEVQQPNSNWVQRNNIEESQQWNSSVFHPNSHMRKKVNLPRIWGQFNQVNNGVHIRTNPNGFHKGRNGDDENINQNFNWNHKLIASSCHEHPSENQTELFRESAIPNGWQNLNAPHSISSKKNSFEPGEIVTYEGALCKFDKYCKESNVKEAIAVLGVIEKLGMAIDIPRYVKLVEACGEKKSLEKAKFVHDHLLHTLGELDVMVFNKILDMYSKCGSIDDAYESFEKMPLRNLTSWEIMIRGLSDNGCGEEALDFFTRFKEIGLKPDGGLFASVIYACGVLGAVDQGMLYFESMKDNFGIGPVMEHYVSIVDMFGRIGYLNEALEFIEAMPIEPNVDVWETLMKFCRINGHTELGDRCAEVVEQLDPCRLKKHSKMVLLPVTASEVTQEKQREKNSDLPDIKRQVVEFKASDRSHPGNDKLYEQIKCLAQQMKEAGYVPEIICALHDVDQESREEALLLHSERLAATHVLMTTPARSPIRIIKNLRVCKDCHNFLKILSKLVGRQIIARDIKRFHHFGNGVCSCNDFW